MGNDGGSIPKRGDLVKTTAKAARIDQDQQNYEKWNLCSLTMEPLEKPVVACKLGRLYKKESVLNFLLGGRERSAETSEAFAHITSLKDVKQLNIKMKEGEPVKGEAGVSRFLCWLSGKELGGKTRAFYYRTCGCVMSFQPLAEIKSVDEAACLVCGKAVGPDDKVVLNGSKEETDELRKRILAEKPSVKKPLKRKAENPEINQVAGPKRLAPDESSEIMALRRNKNIEELYSKR